MSPGSWCLTGSLCCTSLTLFCIARFVVSSWGPCSSTCGPGTRRRYVRCQVYLVYLQDITDLADSECEGRHWTSPFLHLGVQWIKYNNTIWLTYPSLGNSIIDIKDTIFIYPISFWSINRHLKKFLIWNHVDIWGHLKIGERKYRQYVNRSIIKP